MQQVTHRKMSINYKFKNHHYNSQMLQEKLRDSEWKRSKLEIEYNELVQQSKTERETDLMGHKRRYRDLLESEKYRIRRNEQLFAALKRLEMRISFLSATTEKYKALRSKHQVYSNKMRVNTKPIQAPAHYDGYFQNEPVNTVLSNSVDNLNNPHNNRKRMEQNFQKSLSPHAKFIGSAPSESSLYESNIMQNKSAPKPTSQEHSRFIDRNIEQKYFEYPKLSERTPQIYNNPLGVSHETPIDEIVSLPTSYIEGKQDGFRRDEIEYLDNFRHRIPNNSNAMSLRNPKYDSVDRPTSDINKYAIENSDLMTVAPINEMINVPKAHDLKMPEEILRKYQVANDSIAFDSAFPVGENFGNITETSEISNQPNERKENIISHNVIPLEISASVVRSTKNVSESENLPQNVDFEATIKNNNNMSREMKNNSPTVASYEVDQTIYQINPVVIEQNDMVSNELDQTIYQMNPVATEQNEKTVVEERNESHMKIETPPMNPNELKSVEAFPVIENVIPSKVTEIPETQSSPEQEKAINSRDEVKIDYTKRNYVPQINTATERTIDEFEIAPINTATERTIVEFEIAANIEFETFDTGSISSEPKSEKNIEENEPDKGNKERPDDGENVETEFVAENHESVGEKLSQLNLKDDVEHLEQMQLEKPSENNAPNEAVENLVLSNDQEVAEVCQVKTSDENISNSYQNSQQEITDQTPNPEEQHDNSEELEMKKFKKHNNERDQNQYYDQNNQNYPSDQQYDRRGHPINYDPGMASGTGYDENGQPYPQNYDAVYNEKGELVMPYDQAGQQQYDQQYYQNDPNYANYDQYGQQYDDQQQYSGYDQQTYDQQANYDPAQQPNYDPAQQGNYDPAHQQGYGANARYNSYYAEVKYDQGAFYQGDTQENPQHEENEEVDKTSRLANMLESDTENSSRQDNKVTTESDFDYSNN